MFGRRKHQTVITDKARVQEILSRGVDEVIDRESLEKDLLSGKRLRVKLGIDPTSPHIHVGRSTQLLKLRDFQDLGHQAVFIVGDATGIVGDTSDKEAERPMQSKREIKENMETYLEQAFTILDPKKTETHYNSTWLSKLGFHELAKIANLFGLHEFESRDVIARRMKAGKRVSFHELLYPILQGYDSVAVKADVEIGGTDQRFNLLTGRRIQEAYGQKPQNIMMLELLEGTDGRKMSSSWGNVINITDEPDDMFGKTMSIHDELIEKYFVLATRVPLDEVQRIIDQHPKDAKVRLAREIVSLYHGEQVAEVAAHSFEKAFTEGDVPDDIPTFSVTKGMLLRDALAEHGIVSSKSDFRRLVTEGAITNTANDTTIDDPNGVVTGDMELKVGKHRFVRLVVK